MDLLILINFFVSEWKALKQLETHLEKLREANSTLQASQAQLQKIIDSVWGGISYIDSSQRYQFVNRTYEEWFHCSKEEILGRTVEEVTGYEAYQKILPYIERVFLGETVTYEIELPEKGGETRYGSATLTPQFNAYRRVQGYYTLITDVTSRKQVEFAWEKTSQELERLATVDSLTQVANRRSFDKHLQQEWSRAYRHSLPLSVLLCDVDYFKNYNDYYGHQQGDNCLQQIASILSENCQRAEDFVARYGGEEFAIILAGVDGRKATALAERIREQILAAAIPHAGNPQQRWVTLSIGVASTIPQENNQLTDFLAESDRALYQAKASGRNQTICFRF